MANSLVTGGFRLAVSRSELTTTSLAVSGGAARDVVGEHRTGPRAKVG